MAHIFTMLNFSHDPKIAEKQMNAVIFYLTTFGFIDGDFDDAEQAVVEDYIQKLVAHRVETGMAGADHTAKVSTTKTYTDRFLNEFQSIKQRIVDYYTEAVTENEDQANFVRNKLKTHCFEIFTSFDSAGQEALMDIVDQLLMADGVAHPAEIDFRQELVDLLQADIKIEIEDIGAPPPLTIFDEVQKLPTHETHPFFDQFEHHYSKQTDRLLQQLEADQALLDKTAAMFDTKRKEGAGKLAGQKTVDAFINKEPFLDGFVYVVPTPKEKVFDVTVLGDLHGCYSCLKAALLQSDFFDKVEAYQKDPTHHPDPKLVLLGDYIDRGMFSLNGVLRTVMTIANVAPEHVFTLRGNHEFYLEFQGQVFGGVRPAEAINTLKPHAPTEVFQHYTRFFETMPNMLLFGKVLFVHGGVPKDTYVKEHFNDLSSLNDEDIRFQMMWGDPSAADVIPVALQDETVRFSFGRLQAAAFLQRIGCHTLIRGHEKINEGFLPTYNDNQLKLMTVFSSGGEFNQDLPEDSGYRTVTPMALSMKIQGDDVEVTPWKIDYETYNAPQRNSFFATAPEIDHIPE